MVKVATLPVRAGIDWVRDGGRLFLARPLALSGLVGVYLMLMFAASLLPLVGAIAGGVLSPFGTLALMLACKEVAAGRMPTVAIFAVPFRDASRRLELMRLGLLYAALFLSLSIAFDLLGLHATSPAPPTAATAPTELPAPDPQATDATTEAPAALPEGMPDPRGLVLHTDMLLLQFAVYVPLIMAMWFAPVFVGWHRMSPPKAMFFSFFAFWRNKWPILLCMTGALLIAGAASVLVALPLGALGLGAAASTMVLAPWSLAVMAFVQATLFPMYRSIVDDPLKL